MSENHSYLRGSEWRRWDLHIHTKNTAKNDNFNSGSFEDFCKILFNKAIENNIKVIGITDYFNINNYKNIINFVENLDNTDIEQETKNHIRNILILPNVEFRLLPVTDKNRMVNFHCIFNPSYIEQLESSFFSQLKTTYADKKYSLTNHDICLLGKNVNPGITNNEENFKNGISHITLNIQDITDLFKANLDLRKNTITVVSNSNKDGASGFQEHFDFFEGDSCGLDGVRKAIYHNSDLIFSSNSKDKDYFLGHGSDDEDMIIDKCGSIKGCIHGSDAHSEEKLFQPDLNRYCWIKTDPTFDGLKHAILEPKSRIFIGEIPPIKKTVVDNKTKYLKSIIISAKNEEDIGWFNNVEIPLNHGLIAIIGNKGSGKSAIADIIALCGNHKDQNNFSFLHKDKFKRTKLDSKFKAILNWECENSRVEKTLSDEPNGLESIKYISQGYFELLTNDTKSAENFKKELEIIVFGYLDDEDRKDKNSLEELVNFSKGILDKEIDLFKQELKLINNIGLTQK